MRAVTSPREAKKCDPDVIGLELSDPCHGGTAACPAYFFALPFLGVESLEAAREHTLSLQPSDHDVHFDLTSRQPSLIRPTSDTTSTSTAPPRSPVMSQKGGKGAAAKGKKPGGKAGADEKRDDALQAVVSMHSTHCSLGCLADDSIRYWQTTSRTDLCHSPMRSRE